MSLPRFSIRRRLLGWSLSTLILILGAIGIAAHFAAQHESEEIFNARLATSARVLEALVARQLEKATVERPLVITLPAELEHAADDSPTERGHPYENKIAFQAWNEDGRLLARSASAPEEALGPFQAGFSRQSVDDKDWEVFALRSGPVWIIAAERSAVRQEMVRDLSSAVLTPLVVGGLALLLAVNFVFLFHLRPLKGLAHLIAAREPESLTTIRLPETPAELAPIVDELNALLLRVRAAFEREQRFIDSAAHEIRTPIAALQLHVHNAIQASSPQEREVCLAEAALAVRRTSRLAEQLLVFSRLAAGNDTQAHRLLSLAEVCRDVISVQERLLEDRGQSIALDACEDCLISGDPDALHRLLQNLIENASRYGESNGQIEIRVTPSEDEVVLQVMNDGAPIPAEEIERIFTPYYRLKGHGPYGAGLGLAIVEEIATQHKAEVAVAPKSNAQGTVVTVSFPRALQRLKDHERPPGEAAGNTKTARRSAHRTPPATSN